MKKILLAGMFIVIACIQAQASNSPQGVLVPFSSNISSAAATSASAQVLISTPVAPSPYSTGFYNYITNVHIEQFAVANLTGLAGPVLCTSSGLNGAQWGFSTVTTSGTVVVTDVQYANPLQATQAANTSITCPATSNVKWNINVGYYQGN